MATLSPGIIQRLIDAMNSGTKLFREGRSALLQVTEILPVGLDEKDLWPRGGFHVKVSDSSQAIYACLPADQNDLILTNKLRLGQFIQVDGFEFGSPVPILQGINLFPGRHALVGSPELIIADLDEDGAATPSSSSDTAAGASRQQYSTASRRSSWSSGQFSPTVHAFSPKRSDLSAKPSNTPTNRKGKKSQSPSIINGKESFLPKSTLSLSNEPEEKEEEILETLSNKSELSSTRNIYQIGNASPIKCSSLAGVPLPGKFNWLGKEAMEQRVAAQRAAHQALKDASSIETIVRLLKTFSSLSASSKSGAPASCFEQFIAFNDEMTQAIEALEATVKKNVDEEKPSIELARKIKIEGGNWFMEFLAAVSVDFGNNARSKKPSNCGCSHELLSKIINWVEDRDDQNTSRTDHIIKVLRSNLVDNSS